MPNNRTLGWSAATRDLRRERIRRAGVREERLRAAAALRPGSLPLSAWRGRSGKRYVVGIHPLDEAALLDAVEAVVLAVRRDGKGRGRLVAVATAEPEMRMGAGLSWLAAALAAGASEMHVHRLAEGSVERRAVVEDLGAGSMDAS